MRVASDAGEDLVGGFGPNERLGGFVVGGDEFADGGLQFADTAVNPAADLLVGEFGKPPLDQVDPGPVGGRVVDMEAWTLRKPPPDEGRLVGPIVVHDDVDIEWGGTSASIASRNLRNSTERWRRCNWLITRLVFRFNAANNEVVPCRS